MNTVRTALLVSLQCSATADSGTTRVSSVSRARAAASNTPRATESNRGSGTLPSPLPISSIAAARSTAPGSDTSPPPIEPICTKRSARPAGMFFAALTSSVRAVSPQR
ncbi:hypothetical protein WK52_16765 [Burkholderia multivorans]|nr:hypothetical protein WK52_16765 [Burkholderia multivorans]